MTQIRRQHNSIRAAKIIYAIIAILVAAPIITNRLAYADGRDRASAYDRCIQTVNEDFKKCLKPCNHASPSGGYSSECHEACRVKRLKGWKICKETYSRKNRDTDE